jgi:hypothetical protein
LRVILAKYGGFMLEKCPFCGEKFNGVGASDTKILTKILHALPSSHIFYKAGNTHDYNYHICINTRKKSDEIFLHMMLEETKKMAIHKRAWYTAQAYRNYYAVRIAGAKFYGKNRCKKITRRTNI